MSKPPDKLKLLRASKEKKAAASTPLSAKPKPSAKSSVTKKIASSKQKTPPSISPQSHNNEKSPGEQYLYYGKGLPNGSPVQTSESYRPTPTSNSHTKPHEVVKNDDEILQMIREARRRAELLKHTADMMNRSPYHPSSSRTSPSDSHREGQSLDVSNVSISDVQPPRMYDLSASLTSINEEEEEREIPEDDHHDSRHDDPLDDSAFSRLDVSQPSRLDTSSFQSEKEDFSTIYSPHISPSSKVQPVGEEFSPIKQDITLDDEKSPERVINEDVEGTEEMEEKEMDVSTDVGELITMLRRDEVNRKRPPLPPAAVLNSQLRVNEELTQSEAEDSYYEEEEMREPEMSVDLTVSDLSDISHLNDRSFLDEKSTELIDHKSTESHREDSVELPREEEVKETKDGSETDEEFLDDEILQGLMRRRSRLREEIEWDVACFPMIVTSSQECLGKQQPAAHLFILSSRKMSVPQIEKTFGEAVVQIRHVSKEYKIEGRTDAVRALDDIDLSDDAAFPAIKRGEFIMLRGPSGGGKTTLLNLLGTIDKPTEGTLELFGTSIDAKSTDSFLANLRLTKIGFVFQTFNLLATMSAFENVELPMTILGKLGKKEQKERAIELLRLVGLQDRMGHLPSELSGGEQQRVTIARALSNDPDLLLLDEPTGDLDTKNTVEIMDLLLDINKKRKTTCIMVTHNPDVECYADRIIYLQDGVLQRQVYNEEQTPLQYEQYIQYLNKLEQN
ncbi:hypothetical protein PROFUN_13688 [Planoprotostelium fungivorum]|uniref:ABC transporter domain-containing protein n=1 Tax=Planoprotostelium fungivorum TaxID=1890364 RepID=A0A2P6N3D6_9EUKA|nr:hypothetical protein PROFUN_13688 [Planoprotostelium fungivorum]